MAYKNKATYVFCSPIRSIPYKLSALICSTIYAGIIRVHFVMLYLTLSVRKTVFPEDEHVNKIDGFDLYRPVDSADFYISVFDHPYGEKTGLVN